MESRGDVPKAAGLRGRSQRKEEAGAELHPFGVTGDRLSQPAVGTRAREVVCDWGEELGGHCGDIMKGVSIWIRWIRRRECVSWM